MNKTLITFFIFMLLIQNCFAIRSFALPEDSIKTEVKKSKFAAVFGIGLVGGTRLGVRYNFNNYLSAELSFSPLNIEAFLGGNYFPAQIGSIINYKPFKKLGFITSLSFSYGKPTNLFYDRCLVMPNIGYIFNYNKHGFGGFFRIGHGLRYKIFHYGFDNGVFVDPYSNIDFGLFYNF